MTLAFSQQINKKPTYFIGQINNCLERTGIVTTPIIDSYERKYSQLFGFNLREVKEKKLHTIREDKGNRWKAGNNIHFVINNRTKNRFQFAPIVKCVSIQKIEIKWRSKIASVFIEGIFIDTDGCVDLAINDGFENVEAFFAYFNKDFTGKIIHWTNLKY